METRDGGKRRPMRAADAPKEGGWLWAVRQPWAVLAEALAVAVAATALAEA